MSLADSANAFVNGSRAQWAELVKLARGTKPRNIPDTAKLLAKHTGIGRKSIEVKLKALKQAMAAGRTDADLLALGQEKVVAEYVTVKREKRQDAQVVLKWLVSPEVKAGVIRETVRIAKVLGFRTSEEVWQFLLSQFVQWTPVELLHSAGELKDAPNER
jgi:hypothetical protein